MRGPVKQKPRTFNHSIQDFLRPYLTENNLSNKYFRRPGIKLWLCCPQYCRPITSKGWGPQGSHTLHLHNAPKYVPLSKNGLQGTQIYLWRRHLGSTPKPPSTRPGPSKWSGTSHMGHHNNYSTQLTEKIGPRCSLQMVHFRRHNKACRLLLRQWLHNSPYTPLS